MSLLLKRAVDYLCFNYGAIGIPAVQWKNDTYLDNIEYRFSSARGVGVSIGYIKIDDKSSHVSVTLFWTDNNKVDQERNKMYLTVKAMRHNFGTFLNDCIREKYK